MNFLIRIVILFIGFQACAQTLRGKVVDSLTKKPVELVNITFLQKDYGVSTNPDGDFKIAIIDPKDRLQVSSIGYETKIIDVSAYTENKEYVLDIALHPKTEELTEVVVSNTKINYSTEKTLGLKKNLKVRTGFPFGYEFCNLIKNPYSKKGKVKAVILSLNEKEAFDYLATYNIKFYEYDSARKCPGDEIYFENLIVEPKNETYKLKINVDSLGIPFPENGICIGVEIVNTKYEEKIKSMAQIAPSINFTHTDMAILTWTRYRNKKWIVGTSKSQVKDKFVNAMINIDVKIEK